MSGHFVLHLVIMHIVHSDLLNMFVSARMLEEYKHNYIQTVTIYSVPVSSNNGRIQDNVYTLEYIFISIHLKKNDN